MIIFTSEHPYSTDNSERKLQAKIYPYNQIFEQPEEELTPLTNSDWDKIHSDFDKHLSEIKLMNEKIAAMLAKNHDKSDKKIEIHLQPMLVQNTELSSKQSESVQNEVLTITAEHTYSENHFEIKFQDKISTYNQSSEQPE